MHYDKYLQQTIRIIIEGLPHLAVYCVPPLVDSTIALAFYFVCMSMITENFPSGTFPLFLLPRNLLTQVTESLARASRKHTSTQGLVLKMSSAACACNTFGNVSNAGSVVGLAIQGAVGLAVGYQYIGSPHTSLQETWQRLRNIRTQLKAVTPE